MSSSVKKLARRFRRDYMPHKPTAEAVVFALEQQGYTVVPFSSAYNEGPTDTIIRALKLQSYVQSSKGFTYADSSHRLVFIHEGLGQQEKLLVLLHEQGHILCRHFSAAPIVGHEVVQEFEANEFSHYALHPGLPLRLTFWLRRFWLIPLLATLIPLLLWLGLSLHACSASQSEPSGTAEAVTQPQPSYYVTKSGNRYHLADCSHLQDKDEVTELSLEDLQALKYTPCDHCRPGE